jgi:RHS repeat-associated protein
LNRLVDVWRKVGENTFYRRQYEYDWVGNRRELTKNDGGTTTVYDYTYNGLGQLSLVECTSGAYLHNHYTYDKNGNLTERLEEDSENEYVWKYYWDTQDRLVMVTKQNGPLGQGPYVVCVEYKYCASCGGALSERIAYGSDGATVLSWLRYQYHGLNLLRIDERYDSDNDDMIDSNDLWRVMNWYVHGPGSIGQTVRATAYSYNHNKTNSPCETNEYYYCYDALGNVNGVLQDGTYYRWETDAFGNDLAEGNEFLPMTSEGPKEHQTGKMFDGETGLYYFQARWYDPNVGRFGSVDPARGFISGCGVGASKNSLAFNHYLAVEGNPVGYVDPLGTLVEATDWTWSWKKECQVDIDDFKNEVEMRATNKNVKQRHNNCDCTSLKSMLDLDDFGDSSHPAVYWDWDGCPKGDLACAKTPPGTGKPVTCTVRLTKAACESSNLTCIMAHEVSHCHNFVMNPGGTDGTVAGNEKYADDLMQQCFPECSRFYTPDGKTRIGDEGGL